MVTDTIVDAERPFHRYTRRRTLSFVERCRATETRYTRRAFNPINSRA